jgi:hypothetical protein
MKYKYAVAFRIEISLLYLSVGIKYICIWLVSLGNEDGE